MCFSYAISAFMDCTIAASRGINRNVVPTVMVILGSCVFRIFWVFVIFPLGGTTTFLYLIYPVSWILTATAEIIYFAVSYRKARRLLSARADAERPAADPAPAAEGQAEE